MIILKLYVLGHVLNVHKKYIMFQVFSIWNSNLYTILDDLSSMTFEL